MKNVKDFFKTKKNKRNSNYNSLINRLLFKKYRINKLLGRGSFGCAFEGINIIDNSKVAIKVEKKNNQSHLLELESNFLSILKGFGIPEIKSYGYSGNFYILIEELLGSNLSQILKSIKSYTIKDLAMIAIQIIDRLEYVHSKNIIHRDLKPENFLVGCKNNSIIYIIDFGISRKFRSSRTGKHIKFGKIGRIFGTLRYISHNASRGMEQSRRDDLESLAYMLVYLFVGKLPWQDVKLRNINFKKKYLEMLYLKTYLSPETVCKGLPPEFSEYLKYCKNLLFEQDPNYEYLRNLFRNVLRNINSINDLRFSWINNNSNNIMELNMNKEKYINYFKRKETPQKRLYRAIQHSLEKDNKHKRDKTELSELSCEPKKNNNIQRRGKSEDVIQGDRNIPLDNSNLSKDLVTYNSLIVQYNIKVDASQNEKQIYELYNQRRKDKNNIFSLEENINFNKNQFDFISNNINTKNINNRNNSPKFYEGNKKNDIKVKRKLFNLSLDLDINYIKRDNLSESNNKISKSQRLQKKLNKQQKLVSNNKFIDKRKNNCKNVYMNIINKIKNQIYSLKKVKDISNENKNMIRLNNNYKLRNNKIDNDLNNIVNKNLVNEFNLNGENFTFNNFNYLNKNKTLIKQPNTNKKNNTTKKIPKNPINKLKKNLLLKNINDISSIRESKVNSNNINFNINSYKNIGNERNINIIINNDTSKNIKNSRKTPNNKNNHLLINTARDYIPKFNEYKNNLTYTNNKAKENDYNDYYNSINISNSNINKEKITLKQNNPKQLSEQMKYYNFQNQNNNNFKYKIIPNNNIAKKNILISNISKNRKIKIYKYNPLHTYNNQINYTQNNSIDINNGVEKLSPSFKSTTIQNDDSFNLRKMKVIKIKKINPNKEIPVQKYNSNTFDIYNPYNSESPNIIINNVKANMNIFSHKNNFPNDINIYNFKTNINDYLNTERKTNKYYYSPDCIRNKNINRPYCRTPDINRMGNLKSTSNIRNKKINSNMNLINNLEYMNYIPKYNNNYEINDSKLIGQKWFNNLQI